MLNAFITSVVEVEFNNIVGESGVYAYCVRYDKVFGSFLSTNKHSRAAASERNWCKRLCSRHSVFTCVVLCALYGAYPFRIPSAMSRVAHTSTMLVHMHGTPTAALEKKNNLTRVQTSTKNIVRVWYDTNIVYARKVYRQPCGSRP